MEQNAHENQNQSLETPADTPNDLPSEHPLGPRWLPADIALTLMRKRLKLSLEQFATRYGLDVADEEAWETGARRPEPIAGLLLALIAQAPETIARLVQKVRERESERDRS